MTKIPTRKQIRLKNFDYSVAGWYFVTICATVGVGLASARNQNNINNKNKITLSKLGQIIDIHWQNIQNQYDNIKLDKYVVMPNHIHAIISIDTQQNEAIDNRPYGQLSKIIK